MWAQNIFQFGYTACGLKSLYKTARSTSWRSRLTIYGLQTFDDNYKILNVMTNISTLNYGY